MIREMIAEREILEKALESTKANFSRVEADYRQVRGQVQANEGEMAKMKGSINVRVLFDMKLTICPFDAV